MNPLTVIIPSRSVENLVVCAEAVRRHEPGARILVVDDGLEGRRGRDFPAIADAFIEGEKPFVFARNINRGIRAAGPGFRDVVLLNDDAILESPGGFSSMQAAAAADRGLAIVSATTNVANNPAQLQATSGGVRIARRAPGHHFPAVAFVAVLIPALTLETIGLLDERYTAYGWEDTDYCRRIFDARLAIGIDDRCYVDHASLRSSFRGNPLAAGPIDAGRTIYLEKWGK